MKITVYYLLEPGPAHKRILEFEKNNWSLRATQRNLFRAVEKIAEKHFTEEQFQQGYDVLIYHKIGGEYILLEEYMEIEPGSTFKIVPKCAVAPTEQRISLTIHVTSKSIY